MFTTRYRYRVHKVFQDLFKIFLVKTVQQIQITWHVFYK